MKVYKHLGIEDYHFSTLERDQIYVPTRKQLNDPMEGFIDFHFLEKDIEERMDSLMDRLYPNNREIKKFLKTPSIFMADIEKQNAFYKLTKPADDELFNKVRAQIDTITDYTGIYSVTTRPLNELMWAHYSNNHKGFVVEYDSEILAPGKSLIKVKYDTELKKLALVDSLRWSKIENLLLEYEKLCEKIFSEVIPPKNNRIQK